MGLEILTTTFPGQLNGTSDQYSFNRLVEQMNCPRTNKDATEHTLTKTHRADSKCALHMVRTATPVTFGKIG